MATNTYVALKKETVAVATSSVTLDLTGITGYTDLVVVSSVNSARAAQLDSLAVRFNGDTASNYSYTLLQGNTSSGVVSGRASNQTNIFVGNVASNSVSGNFSANVLHIMDYANSTTFKTVLSRGGALVSGLTDTEIVAGIWRKTPEPITSITFRSETGSNINIGSIFSVYGIKAQVTPGTAKATGGTISYDNFGNVYHSFTSSGTFVPTEDISADVLVVAGGGGGGGSYSWDLGAAGGGAGGFQGIAGQALTSSSSYTVTIGAGGGGGSNNRGSNGNNSSFGALTASIGGGGGSGQNVAPGDGGSGGGGAPDKAAGIGTAGQGFNGGSYTYGGGGGGGATATGVAPVGNAGGVGGAGNSSYPSWAITTSTGSSNAYAGGGGGGGWYTSGGAGGIGGGGAGGGDNAGGSTATANTGGGGGGSGRKGTSGAAGGSGIVIIKYAG